MSTIKKILSLIIVFILLLYSFKINAYASAGSPVKVAVFLSSSASLFLSDVTESLENIQKENNGKVQFTFFDSKRNQTTQNENISKSFNGGFNLFIVNPVSSKIEELEDIFNQIASAKIPMIIVASPSVPLSNFTKTLPNTIIIGGDDKQAGILKGKILVDLWNFNKKSIDKNNDNVMQYITLLGQQENASTIARNKYTLQTLKEAGIKVEELSETYCNWDKNCAEMTIESNFLKFDGKIEVIIANSDEMAIGAINALQKYGYNKDDKSKYIPVVGVGGLPEAIELIKQGTMAGTAVASPKDYADALYVMGMNMALGKNPIEDTNYKFDETGNTIKLPYFEYTNH